MLQGLVFDFTSKFSNIDLTDWEADVNHLTLYKQALFLNIPKLREDDITNIAVKNASSRRLLSDVVTEITNTQLILGIYDPSTRSLLSKGLEVITTISVRPKYYDKSGSFTLDSTYDRIVSDIQATSSSVLNLLQSQSVYFQPAVYSSVIFSSYSVKVLHSGYPTSTPTSQPSCGAGFIGDSVNCVPCVPGTFLSDFNKDVCEPCPLDHYSNDYGSVACTVCPSPYGAYHVGSTECTAYYLNYSGQQLNFLVGSFVFLFLFAALCAGRKAFAVFAVMLFPAMDVTTDIMYLVSTRFYNFPFFIVCLITLIVPNMWFVTHLYHENAVIPHGIYKSFPGWYFSENLCWLSMRKGYPMMNGKSLSISFEKHDTLPKVCSYYLTWLLVMAAQVLFILTYVAWLSSMTLIMIAWFAMGLFLFATKVMAIKRVHNWWYLVWTGSSKHDTDIEIDVAMLNEAMFAEFLFESLPQMVVQSMNNTLTQLWNPIGVFSMCLSVAVMLNGLYRYGYYSFWLGYSIQNVPTEISFGGIKVSVEDENDKKGKDNEAKKNIRNSIVDIESSIVPVEEIIYQLKSKDILCKEVTAVRDSVARYMGLTDYDDVGKHMEAIMLLIGKIEIIFSRLILVKATNASEKSATSSSRRTEEARASIIKKMSQASDSTLSSKSLLASPQNSRLSMLVQSATRTNNYGKTSFFSASNNRIMPLKSDAESVGAVQPWTHDSNSSDSSSSSSSDDEVCDIVRPPESAHMYDIPISKITDSVISDLKDKTVISVRDHEIPVFCKSIENQPVERLRITAIEEARLAKEAEEERLRIAAIEEARLAKEAEEERLRLLDPMGLFAPIIYDNGKKCSRTTAPHARHDQKDPEKLNRFNVSSSNTSKKQIAHVGDPLGLFTDIVLTSPSTKKLPNKSKKK